jgi:LacI family transcriptional regulator
MGGRTRSGNGKPQVSLRAIAQETGVSIATVSRVLRGQDECRTDTRARVLAAAERLGYRPNLLVHALQTGRSRTVGVMVYVGDEFGGRVAVGIHDTLIAANHVPIFAWTHPVRIATDRSDELAQIHRLVDRRVDAVILFPREDTVGDDYLHEVWERNIPLVTVDDELARSHADFVGTDDEFGGRLAAEHLLALGHRRLAHVAGPDKVTSGRLRRKGFEEAVAACPGASCATVVDPTYGQGAEQVRQALSATPRPTALFCANDYIAFCAFRVAAELGLAIPRDLSVVGFADLLPARHLSPPLTTLRQDPEGIGKAAATLVLDRLEGRLTDPEPQRIRLKPELVARRSTAVPPT